MAGELTTAVSFRYSKNGVELARSIGGTIDVSGNAFCYAIQNIGTTEENLIVNDVSTNGYCIVKNVDATNYVTLGKTISAVYQPFLKIKPGESQLIRFDSGTIQAKANTAAINLEYWLISD